MVDKFNTMWLLQIPGLSEDPTQQPFQDIAVGGMSIPGHEPGYLAVWAVTFQGKVCHMWLSPIQVKKSMDCMQVSFSSVKDK